MMKGTYYTQLIIFLRIKRLEIRYIYIAILWKFEEILSSEEALVYLCPAVYPRLREKHWCKHNFSFRNHAINLSKKVSRHTHYKPISRGSFAPQELKLRALCGWLWETEE